MNEIIKSFTFNSINMRFIKGIVVFIVVFFTPNVKAIYLAHDALAYQFRYHAAIDVYRIRNEPPLLTSMTKWDCSGAVISSKYVITSYKCVHGYNFDGSWLGTTFQIKVGCVNLNHTTCLSYNSTIKPRLTHLPNLIALIEVNYPQEITIDYRIQPVTLPTKNSRYSVSTSDSTIFYVATGFREVVEGKLRYVYMKIVPMSDCEPLPENTIPNSSLCLHGVDRIYQDHVDHVDHADRSGSQENLEQLKGSLCFSEFGVPLVDVQNQTLIGIFYYTDPKCPMGGPSLFFKIEPFVDWIKEWIGGD